MAPQLPRPPQDDQEPLLKQWRSMSALNCTSASTHGEPTYIDKSEVDVAASATTSDTEVNKAGFRAREREGFTFVSEGLGKDHYRPVDSYEGIHRYDPDFEWEPQEERKVVRKVLPKILTAVSQLVDIF